MSSRNKKLSRDEFQRQKLLDEQRKAGNAPAEIDVETGKDINPHIPQWMAQAPWYVDSGHTTLKHQRLDSSTPIVGSAGSRVLPNINQKKVVSSLHETESLFSQRYKKIINENNNKNKVSSKSICENCGSSSHITKDCLERPRKNKKVISRGFRKGFDESTLFTKRKGNKPYDKPSGNSKDSIDELELAFEAKRDRWNGYVAETHIEEAKSSNSNALEKNKIKMDGKTKEQETKQPVSNLRIREDTAKYLRNLDIDSAHYDPKTRSMREAPLKDVVGKMSKGQVGMDYIGDNFLRYTGETQKVLDMQAFAWEASGRHHEAGVHMEANPTQSEKLYSEYQLHKKEISQKVKQSVLSKYGGEEHLTERPKELGN